jgi:hypothetical protein
MKRLLATLTVIMCLSFPVFGGHVLGTGVYCECDNPQHGMFGLTVENEAEIKQDSTPNDEVSELDLLIDILQILIRL